MIRRAEGMLPNMTTASSRTPLVFIVSGPSGCGKSTLVNKLLELPEMMFSISVTTRKPRATEQPGKWYTFVSEAEFQRMVQGGEFLEHARVFGRHGYGTPRRWLDEASQKGLDLVLEIDVQGAAQVKSALPDAISIFILPPSRQALEQRLRARGQNDDLEIRTRLSEAQQEILEHLKSYHYIVINDQLERAGRETQAIALAARCRTAFSSASVQDVLRSFGG
jgi:guanylate kinase